MDANNWVAVIGCVLIILATLFGRWWILHRQYRKQNNTEVLDEERQKFLDRLDATFAPTKPIEERWPVIDFEVTKLDILTSAKDLAHPHGKHLMRFQSKNFNFAMNGIIYKFKCLYCNFETKLLFKDFWGKPKPVISTPSLSPIAEYMSRQREPRMDRGLTEEWANWGRKSQLNNPDRTDALTMSLLAYAESIQKPIPKETDDRFSEDDS